MQILARCSTMSPMARALLFALLVMEGCPKNSGSFDPVKPDEGSTQPGPTANDIGATCSYFRDGAGPGPNPTNTCPPNLGLSCLIFTRDGAYTSGLALSAWEDQFTLYSSHPGDSSNRFTDEGYCTLMGSRAAPPECPVGTIRKLLSPDVEVCLRTCTTPASCAAASPSAISRATRKAR